MTRKIARKPASESADRRLKLYSLAAAAAGVSVLALSQPSEGEVIVTKKAIQLHAGIPVSVDLNKDGLADFKFSFTIFYSSFGYKYNAKLAVKGLTRGKVVGPKRDPYRSPYASALVGGANIGPAAHFSSSKGQITVEREKQYGSATGYYGYWHDAPNRFLGVKFQIKGQTHYGWIRLNFRFGSTMQINGWAYETVANKRITAGETTSSVAETNAPARRLGLSLGVLALGADGRASWRRDEEFNTSPN
ncbi:MAG: hypothetical protein ACRD3B_16965 [Candidatus Sulfotelmatobacter sp.]